MINAKIVNNIPTCKNCNNDDLGGIREYKAVLMNNQKYTLFQKQCYKCRTLNQYLADVLIDKTIRYEITDNIKTIE